MKHTITVGSYTFSINCGACVDGISNQLGHMEFGGCLYEYTLHDARLLCEDVISTTEVEEVFEEIEIQYPPFELNVCGYVTE